VLIFNAGLPVTIGGTSASSPTFAAILTRINEERIAVGKSTIGFVNPTLYANPQVLHDITSPYTLGYNPSKPFQTCADPQTLRRQQSRVWNEWLQCG